MHQIPPRSTTIAGFNCKPLECYFGVNSLKIDGTYFLSCLAVLRRQLLKEHPTASRTLSVESDQDQLYKLNKYSLRNNQKHQENRAFR